MRIALIPDELVGRDDTIAVVLTAAQWAKILEHKISLEINSLIEQQL